MVTVTSVEAQNRFGQLIGRSQREIVTVTRHGRTAAFIVSPRDMEELMDSRRRRSRAVAELEKSKENTSQNACLSRENFDTRASMAVRYAARSTESPAFSRALWIKWPNICAQTPWKYLSSVSVAD
jgi:antitoxin Phd